MEKKTIKLGLGSFDLAKGTAILLVVLSHTFGHYDWSQSSAQQIISVASYILGTSFLTAFFIISGMGLKIKTPKRMLKKSFTDLIVPYLWIAAAYECFILGKHTARNGVAGISPPRREFQKC